MKAKFKRGVVIGKFYPFHKGHNYLVETAKSQVEQLFLIICYRPDQIPDIELRREWIVEKHPDIMILTIDDTGIPDSDSKLWAQITIELLGFKPDVAFTSEDYGKPWCKFMGCRHILVDKKREVFPVSGTKVRENPYEIWNQLTPALRAYYAKRVCIIGAESTGTTTLANDLAKHLETVWACEYGRYYSIGKMDAREGFQWDSDEFVHIAKMQSQMEDALARRANKVVICDTDAFATSVWHERYMGGICEEVEKIADNRKYDLYILTGDEIPFEQDGYRDGEHIRHWMHERFEEKLRITGRNFITVRGDRESRLIKALGAISELFNNQDQ